MTELFAKVESLVRLLPSKKKPVDLSHITAAAAFIAHVDRPRTLHRNFRLLRPRVQVALSSGIYMKQRDVSETSLQERSLKGTARALNKWTRDVDRWTWCLKSCSVGSGDCDDGIGHLDVKRKNTCLLLESGSPSYVQCPRRWSTIGRHFQLRCARAIDRSEREFAR